MHEKCTKGRGEGERVNERYTHSNCHCKSELLVEHSGCTSHEAHRDEHCHKHECSRDKGCREFAHCIYSSLIWRLVAYIELGLDSLHHDNGVIHHRTDHQHQREQRNHVQTESCHHKEGKCSEQ